VDGVVAMMLFKITVFGRAMAFSNVGDGFSNGRGWIDRTGNG